MLIWLNWSITTINATFQLLDIYIYIYIYIKEEKILEMIWSYSEKSNLCTTVKRISWFKLGKEKSKTRQKIKFIEIKNNISIKKVTENITSYGILEWEKII